MQEGFLSAEVALALLADLTESFARVHDAITMIDQAVNAPVPALDPTTRARWQLSRAERARRAAVDEALAALAGRALPDLDAVAQKRREVQAYLRDYVWKWSPEAMQADWDGYRAAFADKRTRLLALIEQEQKLVVPILVEQGRG